jgi:hypothetical protein
VLSYGRAPGFGPTLSGLALLPFTAANADALGATSALMNADMNVLIFIQQERG